MTKKEYNGWTNYETWLVKLWMDNEEGSSNYWHEQAEMCLEQTDRRGFEDTEASAMLSDMLKERHEEIIYETIPQHLHASFIMDLMNAAMSEVNWYEIAESLLQDAKEKIAQ